MGRLAAFFFTLYLGISDEALIISNITNLMKMSNCSNLLELSNNQWKSKCVEETKLCRLESEPLLVDGINEITIKFSASIINGVHYLLLYSKKKSVKEDIQGYVNKFEMTTHSQYKINSFETKFETKDYTNFSVEFHYVNFCGTINYIYMEYYTCENSRHHSVKYDKHSAPSSQEEKLIINGTCSRNSIILKQNLYAECYPNGTVQEFGKCVCSEGYTLNRGKCEKCLNGYYKNIIGDQKCEKCGEKSFSFDRKECHCEKNAFREILHKKNSSSTCYEPKFTIEFSKLSENKVLMTWKEWGLLNLKVNTSFLVSCLNCKEKEGNFPINTKELYSVLENLIDKKYYYLSLTALYKQENEFLFEKIVYCGFETTKQRTNDTVYVKKTDIIIISITIPVIIISFLIILYLYVKQKRRTIIFLRRINSLKRLRRPPPPPERADSTASEINPYAYSGKIPELKSDDESFDINKRKENRYSTLTDSQPKRKIPTPNQPSNNKQNIEQIENAYSNWDGSLFTEDNDGYINMNANFLKEDNFHTQHIYDNPEPRKPRSKTFNEGKIQQGFKSKSIIYPDDSFAMRLSVHDINKAKLNNKYKRIGSQINRGYDIPRTHHSADDISKLYDMLT